MLNIAHFGMYGDQSRIPEWIQAEKYEYCENFFEARVHSHFEDLKIFISNIFNK